MNEKLPNSRIVGVKQTLKAIKNSNIRIVYLANNAETNVINPIIEICHKNNIEITYSENMYELGKLCGIEVGAAAACLLKD